jgi:hypothetical protein
MTMVLKQIRQATIQRHIRGGEKNPYHVATEQDGYRQLALHIIQRAARDIESKRHRDEVCAFFRSEWYQLLLAYVGMDAGVYPVGVKEYL